jgi:hypothetical protein
MAQAAWISQLVVFNSVQQHVMLIPHARRSPLSGDTIPQPRAQLHGEPSFPNSAILAAFWCIRYIRYAVFAAHLTKFACLRRHGLFPATLVCLPTFWRPFVDEKPLLGTRDFA